MTANMRKINLRRRVRASRKDQFKDDKLSEINFKIGEKNERYPAESRTIKTFTAVPWNKMGKVKEELKAMLPKLTPSEVRRFYLSSHEAIIDELQENGYEDSIKYLRELFELDEETRKEAGPGTLTWKKPRLMENRDAMTRLKEGLIAYEKAKNAGDPISMTMVFLDMALFFQAMTWEWWWVAERLYRSALMNAKLIKNDDQRTISLMRYLLGRFLFEQMQNTAESLVLLNAAREASQGKTWNASRITGRKEETLFRECSILLYKALLMHAQQVDPDQPDVAVKACTEALALATDSGYEEYVANALHELGKYQLRSGDVKSTLRNFSKLLAIAKRIPDPERICSAHLALASAYKLCELGDAMNTEKHLRLSRENATAFGLTRELARAHYCTGEYFLSKRRPDIATLHFDTSFNLYYELDLYDDADKARSLAGVSRGQKVLEQYIDLILRCGIPTDQRAISMLREWKDRRSTFSTGEELCIDQLAEPDAESSLNEKTSSLSLSSTTDTMRSTERI